jgi:lipopolysaccharide heptosyltransferase II
MPNWLGDMVMASAFIQAVQEQYPGCTIDLIIKKELEFLSPHLPAHGRDYIFSKKEYAGLKGAKKFGQQIRKEKKYDLFFCLPESASSAAMGNETGAKKRIGFRRAVTFLFFTNTYKRKKNIHRVEEYISLLAEFTGVAISVPPVQLNTTVQQKNNSLIININSEASSRRLPKEKAVSIVNTIRKQISNEIILIGSPKEKISVEEVFELLEDKTGVSNMAGNTSLPELITLFAAAKGMLSTDSGPAHVSNAVGTNTIVLFGAGNENNTAPYNRQNCVVIRLGKLSCEPCTDNVCKRYGTPECLLQLDEALIAENVKKILS